MGPFLRAREAMRARENRRVRALQIRGGDNGIVVVVVVADNGGDDCGGGDDDCGGSGTI